MVWQGWCGPLQEWEETKEQAGKQHPWALSHSVTKTSSPPLKVPILCCAVGCSGASRLREPRGGAPRPTWGRRGLLQGGAC